MPLRARLWTAGRAEPVNRAQAFRQALEAAGGRLIGIWWTLGHHDGVFIFEAADDAAATQALVALGMLGNIRTDTMRAFSEEEMVGIVGGTALEHLSLLPVADPRSVQGQAAGQRTDHLPRWLFCSVGLCWAGSAGSKHEDLG